MAFSFTQHIGDGETTTFTFSFVGPGNGYYEEDQIKVYLDDVDTTFTLSGPNQITLDEAPAEGVSIWIKREPDITDTYTNFARGNSFGKDNINRAFQQMLYLVQRIQDGFKEEGYYQKQAMNLGNFKITNLADGTDDTDACTYGQMYNQVSSNAANLAASVVAQEAAEAAAAAALDSQTLAKSWASEDEDVEVSAGEYSAYHWAMKSAAVSAGNASNVAVTPYGYITSVNVQDALEEVADHFPSVVTTSSDGLMISADKTKLDGIETGATGDQTASEIKTALLTVDGAGSGLDSDKLDGREGTAFSYSEANSSDVNTIVHSGFYRMSENTNLPSTCYYGQLIVARSGSSDTILQIAGDYHGTTLLWRAGNGSDVGGSGSWSSWRTIWHSGNMDTGADSIGSVVLASYNGNLSAGATVAGSSLSQVALKTDGTAGGRGTLSGTYRALNTVDSTYVIGLFQRIA